METTLIILKPDAVQRGLLGSIVSRIEAKGLKIVGMKMVMLDERQLKVHYSHLTQRSFYPEIAEFMRRTPVVALCAEGLDCVAVVRRLCGITLAREAEPGTIRGDMAMSVQTNLVHASDSVEAAEVELGRLFEKEELFDYALLLEDYLYAYRERGLPFPYPENS